MLEIAQDFKDAQWLRTLWGFHRKPLVEAWLAKRRITYDDVAGTIHIKMTDSTTNILMLAREQ